MLKESDFVVLAASLMAATHGLINADRLAVMKPGACLIHVGRAAQVDEAALVEALGTRPIAVRRLMCLNASHCRRNSRTRQALAISSGTVTGSWLSDNLRRYLEHKRLPFVVTREKDINCSPCYSFLDTCRTLSTDSALHAKCISWDRTSWNRASF